jgi:prepilin-type processing-associated H-X9-DG protein/prepilin-type N-terminal cleavage/methylation domain-containing protein
MKPTRFSAFTLVELLVVIVILSLLMALLVPVARSVLRACNLTRCQVNLRHLYEGQCTWRADQGGTHFATGPDWADAVLPYLEGRKEVLRCPESDNPWSESDTTLTLGDVAFEIYTNHSRTDYKYDIPLDSDFIHVESPTDHPENEGWKEYQIEDQQTGGDHEEDHKDIVVEIQFVAGRPVNIYFSPNHSGHGFGFKFKIGGEIIYDNYDSGDTSMIPSTMDLRPYGVRTSDYGMSRGSYERSTATVPKPDGKLFFILDYPLSVADYMEPTGGDEWKRFFVVDPAYNPVIGAYQWQPPPDCEGWTWRQVTALRHFEKANVLFCDGHVETLGIDPLDVRALLENRQLRADCPLWRYTE